MYVDPEEYLFGLRFGVSDFPIFSGNLIYVSAERIGPKKIYPLSVASAARKDLGNSGELAWNYLSVYRSLSLEEDDPRSQGSVANQLEDVTNLWLREVAPGTRLSLDDIPSADALTAGFSFVQPGNIATRAFRATNVGFGLSYTLPVIVAFLMPKNTLCLIENPEAHLHPSGQTKMAELAARAAKAGVQVMVETHSDHFIDGIRIAVREGLLTSDDVAIHYFERQGNESVVRSPVIDSDGRLSECGQLDSSISTR